MLSCWYSGTKTRCCAATSAGCVTSRPTGVWFVALAGLIPRTRWTDDERDGPHATVTDIDTQQIRRKPILNDLINEYTHAA